MDSETSWSQNDEQQLAEIVCAERLADAAVTDIVEATPGVVLARDAATLRSSPEPEQEITESQPYKDSHLKHAIECMLFVSPGPLSAQQIAEALQVDEQTVEAAMNSLQEHLDAYSGLQLMRIAGGYQLCTRPEYADYCALILQPVRRKLSRAALETLAIIAYRQPCTTSEIEAVRGVNVDGVMKTLQDRGLIREAGRKHAPGRPALFVTTPEFLEYFGLDDLSELPDIDVFAADAVKALEAQRELLLSHTTEDGQAVAEPWSSKDEDAETHS